MICPLARAGAAVGTGNLEGTRLPTKRGSDHMSSRGIFTTDLSRQGVGQGRTRHIKERLGRASYRMDAVGDAGHAGYSQKSV